MSDEFLNDRDPYVEAAMVRQACHAKNAEARAYAEAKAKLALLLAVLAVLLALLAVL